MKTQVKESQDCNKSLRSKKTKKRKHFDPRICVICKTKYSPASAGQKYCVYCRKHKVKRLAVGIFECEKCEKKFTGKAYSLRKQKNVDYAAINAQKLKEENDKLAAENEDEEEITLDDKETVEEHNNVKKQDNVKESVKLKNDSFKSPLTFFLEKNNYTTNNKKLGFNPF